MRRAPPAATTWCSTCSDNGRSDAVTRDRAPGPDPEDDGPQEPREGHVKTTSPEAITGFALTGLVLGWLLHPVSIRLSGTAPTVGWAPVGALALVAAIIGYVAWVTHRDLQRAGGLAGGRLQPHQAVNRLVLGKACALVGALVAGGYAGYALSWVGMVSTTLVRERVVQSVVAAVCAALVVVGSLFLERACRVKDDED